jgi:hypothetical protein
VLTAVALAWVDIRVRKERALIGNLGMSRVTVSGLCAVPAALGETLIVVAGFTG